MEKILIIGSNGQIGVELTTALRQKFGSDNVWATDIREEHPLLKGTGPYQILDVMDTPTVEALMAQEQFTQVYLMAAILSATGEKNPLWAWNINMTSLLSILDLSVKYNVKKVFWPSSIAVFGRTTPNQDTPQKTIIEPTTVYGISKYAGELWIQYYNEKFGLDVRGVRYPGLISWKNLPGGGTTDYAIDIYIQALKEQKYECFLSENTYLPMMYMDDAIRATIELMDAPKNSLKTNMCYNISAMSFSPKEIAENIKKHIPEFTISYAPDFRQGIADTWPKSIEDADARKDWNWEEDYDLDKMTETMLKNLKSSLSL